MSASRKNKSNIKKRIAYFDCSSGISGDMILGALVDLGVDIKKIRAGLGKLDLKGYQLKSRIVKRGMISGVKVDVATPKKKSSDHHRHSHRAYLDIKKLINDSALSPTVKSHADKVFQNIARVEAAIHRVPVSKIHFHEVGAVDSIVDIVGGVLGLELLGVDEIHASSINTGEGTVQCDHGLMPVPAPATLKLLEGVPCYSSGEKQELATPTGVAMIAHFARSFGSMPEMTVLKSGYGAGTHVTEKSPNLLRIIVGETEGGGENESVYMVETNIDDMNPELYEHVMDQLFALGAADVFFTPIQMKKNRPATQVSVLVSGQLRDRAIETLLAETSTFGVRCYRVDRTILDRELRKIKTPMGMVTVKVGMKDGRVLHTTPEYEDCKKIAHRKNLPLKKVYEEVLNCIK